MEVLNIVSHWPGSTHDARIWDNSRVSAQFEEGLHNGLLDGDSGYALSRYLMTPVLRKEKEKSIKKSNAQLPAHKIRNTRKNTQ